MLPNRNKAKDIMEQFKAKQELIKVNENNKQKKINRGFDNLNNRDKSIKTKTTFYEKYKYKLEKGQLNKFNSRDIIYFMLDKAKENNIKCVISNWRVAMHQINLVKKKGHDTEDILAMIEFLYTSGQKYIDLNRICPSLLTTQWITTIYADTLLWLDDKYDPNTKNINKRKSVNEREWKGEKTEEEKADIDWGF